MQEVVGSKPAARSYWPVCQLVDGNALTIQVAGSNPAGPTDRKSYMVQIVYVLAGHARARKAGNPSS